MTKITDHRPRRRRGKTLIALFTAAAALSAGSQALAPAPASAFVDLGSGCTVNDWGFIACEAPQSGDEGWPWEDDPGGQNGTDYNGGDVPSNVYGDDNGNGDAGNQEIEPAPPETEPAPPEIEPAPPEVEPAPPAIQPTPPPTDPDEDLPFGKPGETMGQLNLRWKRQNCRKIWKREQRVKNNGIDWTDRLWKLNKTKEEVLNELVDEYEADGCYQVGR